MKGKFIVFEGIDCCGKSTQIKKSHNYLFDRGVNVLTTFEPSNSKYGKMIRHMMEMDKDPKEHKDEYAKIFYKDRMLHLNKVIFPPLYNGVYVLCDRYKHSTLAYQQAQGMELEELLAMHNGMLVPDITFYLDITPKISIKRKYRRKGKPSSVFEKLEFLKEVRNNYLNLIKTLNENIVTIDATGTADKVFERIRPHLDLALQKDL